MKNTENKIYPYEKNNKLTYPGNEASYYLEQSNLLVFSGNIYAALENVEKAINLKKDYVTAYYQKARILFSLGKRSEAEACFDQANKLEEFLLDDEVAQRYYYKSTAEYYLDNKKLLEGGSNIIKTVVSHDDRKLYCSNSKLGIPVPLNNPANKQMVIDNYDMAIKHNPFNMENYYKMATALIIAGKFEGALNMYDKVAALGPGDPLPYYNKSIVLLAMNKPEQAIINYNCAKKLKLQENLAQSDILDLKDINMPDSDDIVVSFGSKSSFGSFKDLRSSHNESSLLGDIAEEYSENELN